MLSRLRWGALGLRGRIVGAVVVTTAVTLGVAALVLLPRLEGSLQNASEQTLQAAVRDASKPGGELQKLRALDYRQIALLKVPGVNKRSFPHLYARAAATMVAVAPTLEAKSQVSWSVRDMVLLLI